MYHPLLTYCSGQNSLWECITTPCQTKLVMWPPYRRNLLCLKYYGLLKHVFFFFPSLFFRNLLISTDSKPVIAEVLKWLNEFDHTFLYRYTSAAARKAWKFRSQRRFGPWPLRCRCSAPPDELSGHLGAGRCGSIIRPRRRNELYVYGLNYFISG